MDNQAILAHLRAVTADARRKYLHYKSAKNTAYERVIAPDFGSIVVQLEKLADKIEMEL